MDDVNLIAPIRKKEDGSWVYLHFFDDHLKKCALLASKFAKGIQANLYKTRGAHVATEYSNL
jgi:hypothetical protein